MAKVFSEAAVIYCKEIGVWPTHLSAVMCQVIRVLQNKLPTLRLGVSNTTTATTVSQGLLWSQTLTSLLFAPYF